MPTSHKPDNGLQLVVVMSLLILGCIAAVAITFHFGAPTTLPVAQLPAVGVPVR